MKGYQSSKHYILHLCADQKDVEQTMVDVVAQVGLDYKLNKMDNEVRTEDTRHFFRTIHDLEAYKLHGMRFKCFTISPAAAERIKQSHIEFIKSTVTNV